MLEDLHALLLLVRNKTPNKQDIIQARLGDYEEAFDDKGNANDKTVAGMLQHWVWPEYREIWERSRYEERIVVIGRMLDDWLLAQPQMFENPSDWSFRNYKHWLSHKGVNVDHYTQWKTYRERRKRRAAETSTTLDGMDPMSRSVKSADTRSVDTFMISGDIPFPADTDATGNSVWTLR